MGFLGLERISGVLSCLRRLEEAPLDAEDNVSDTGSALGNGFGKRVWETGLGYGLVI